MYSKIQYISQGTTVSEQLTNIEKVLDAGCDWIQLRFKNATENELINSAESVKKLCEKYKATFIVNDHVELAKKINADGVHLGLQDTSIKNARAILGSKKIIGGTANTLNDVLKRVEEKCDYIGLGPFAFTITKEKLSPVLGIEGYQKIMNELQKINISIPIYAIGGIELEDVESIVNTGVYGIAVSGLITHHNNKRILFEQLNQQLNAVIKHSR
ncbi:MAG TPA: thiamine phosphate synthase [Bacteroidia bacterium]|nr:thiamine phosphate synthase [Bacteroidia bacterium]